MNLNQNQLRALLLLSMGLAVSPGVFAEQNSVSDLEVQSVPKEQALDEHLTAEERAELREEFRHKRHHHRKHMAEKRMRELDQNNDEKVDLNEYLSHAEARFNELDANSDGFVTREEARERHKELREKHRQHRKQMQGDLEEKAESNE